MGGYRLHERRHRRGRRDHVIHPGTFFQVFDGEHHTGVVPVEGVKLDRSPVQVGEETEMQPVGPELLLGSDRTSAAQLDDSELSRL